MSVTSSKKEDLNCTGLLEYLLLKSLHYGKNKKEKVIIHLKHLYIETGTDINAKIQEILTSVLRSIFGPEESGPLLVSLCSLDETPTLQKEQHSLATNFVTLILLIRLFKS